MLADILTVAGKEFKEIIKQGGRRGGWSYLILLGVFGVFFPLQAGPEGVQSGTSAFILVWLAYLSVSNAVVDSFAGERERRTLETLLATRLSDTAILLGKFAAAAAYGIGISLALLIVSVISVNLLHPGQGLIMYSPLALGLFLVGLLVIATLAAGLGVLVSLRAPTVRQAQQTMSMAMFALFVPIILLSLLPDTFQERAFATLQGVNPVTVLLAVIAVVVAVDVGLVLAALARFKRARLILD